MNIVFMMNVQIIPFLGDRAKEFAQKRACIEAQGWEPYQEWFYDNEFRQETKLVFKQPFPNHIKCTRRRLPSFIQEIT